MAAIETHLEKQRHQGCNDDNGAEEEGFIPAIPVNPGIDYLLHQGAKALPVRPVLPAEHLPNRVLLEQRGVVKVPLVPKQHIDGVRAR